MFGVPPRKTIAEELVEQRLRDKAPPTQGHDSCSLEPSLLVAQFQSLEEKTFIFVVPVENYDGAKSHRNIAGDDVFQILRQNTAANANRSRKIGTTPALRQRARPVKNRRRHKSLDLFHHPGCNANWYLNVDRQWQVGAMLLHRTNRQQQDPLYCLFPNVLTVQFLEIAHTTPIAGGVED